MVALKIAYASHEAVKWACLKYHYAAVVPAGAKVSYGVWEDGEFIGVVIFGPGANRNMGKQYGLKMNQVCELVRVALKKHKTPVSRVLSICLRLLAKKEKNLQLVVSYADANAGHYGGIYQASGWTYVGRSGNTRKYIINGIERHPKAIDDQLQKRGYKATIENIRKYIDKSAEIVPQEPKHKYLFALNPDIKEKILSLAKPYPKRVPFKCVASADSGTTTAQVVGDGASPIATLNEEGGEG